MRGAADAHIRVPDKLQRVSVAAQSRDPEAVPFPAAWAPALQRTAEGALRCVRGTSRVHLALLPTSYARLRILAAWTARALLSSPPSQVPRAQGRPGAGWHPRSAVREMRWKQMHSGIQVKPNIRPSLRSGFTAYVVISPGSDALLPPSPCGWLTRPPGWAAHVTARLGTQTPDARTTRFCRTQAAPVVRAQAVAHGVSRPANHLRADAACVHHVPSRMSWRSRYAPRPGWDGRNMR